MLGTTRMNRLGFAPVRALVQVRRDSVSIATTLLVPGVFAPGNPHLERIRNC